MKKQSLVILLGAILLVYSQNRSINIVEDIDAYEDITNEQVETV